MAGYAVIGAAGYGASDLAGGIASRKHRVALVLTASQAVSLGFMALAALVIPGVQHVADAARGGIAGVLVFAGVALVYMAFSRGDIGPAAALLGVFSALVPVTAAAVTGETLGAGVGVGLVAAAAAVYALADGRRENNSRRSLTCAVGAGIAFGAYQVTMSTTSPDGGMWPLASAQVVVVLLAFGWFVASVFREGVDSIAEIPGPGQFPPVPTITFPWLATVAGTIEAVGGVAALWAVRTGNLAVVGVILALAPAASVLLARLMLGERMTQRRMLGLGAAVLAVVALTGGVPLVALLLAAGALSGAALALVLRLRLGAA